MKNYLLLSLKKKIPLFVILLVIFLIIALIAGVNADFIKTTVKEGYYYHDDGDPAFLGLLIFLFSVVLFLPFFSMNYRYSLAKSDTFRQVGFKEKHIRYGEHISTLLVTLASFTLAFITLVIILVIRNGSAVAPIENEYYRYEVIRFNFIYYIPLYFAAIGFAVLQYFISYFLISRSNNFLNSLIILLVGQGFLTCIPTLLGHFYFSYYSMFSFVGSIASFIFPIVYLNNQFGSLILSNTNTVVFSIDSKIEQVELIVFIISVASFIAIGVIGLISFLYEKDPSSEWANKPGSDKPYQEMIYHMGSGAMATLIAMGLITSSDNIVIWLVLFYFLFSATYYTVYGLLNRNFKLKLREVLTLVGVTLGSLIIAIIYLLIYTNQHAPSV